MSAHNNKKLLKQLVTLMGVASASTLLAFPALANIDSSSSGQLFAQSDSGNTQQDSGGTSGTPETLGTPIPQPQIPPVGTGTIPQTLGSPISPLGTGTIQQFPTGTGTIQQFPGGTNTTQPNTQINGM